MCGWGSLRGTCICCFHSSWHSYVLTFLNTKTYKMSPVCYKGRAFRAVVNDLKYYKANKIDKDTDLNSPSLLGHFTVWKFNYPLRSFSISLYIDKVISVSNVTFNEHCLFGGDLSTYVTSYLFEVRLNHLNIEQLVAVLFWERNSASESQCLRCFSFALQGSKLLHPF